MTGSRWQMQNYLLEPSEIKYSFSIPCASKINQHNSLTAPLPPPKDDLKLQIS